MPTNMPLEETINICTDTISKKNDNFNSTNICILISFVLFHFFMETFTNTSKERLLAHLSIQYLQMFLWLTSRKKNDYKVAHQVVSLVTTRAMMMKFLL